MDINWIDWADIHVSSKYNLRPPNTTVDLVVIHGINIGQFGDPHIVNLLAGKRCTESNEILDDLADSNVSCHFLIRRNGETLQFVPLYARAWHAGISSFHERKNCNDFSVGIELEGTDHTPYSPAQYYGLNRLLLALSEKLPIRHVATHAQVAPERKTDPGVAFEWSPLENTLKKLNLTWKNQ